MIDWLDVSAPGRADDLGCLIDECVPTAIPQIIKPLRDSGCCQVMKDNQRIRLRDAFADLGVLERHWSLVGAAIKINDHLRRASQPQVLRPLGDCGQRQD